MYRTVFLLLVLCHGLPGDQQMHPGPQGGGAGGAGGLDIDGGIAHHAGAVSKLWASEIMPAWTLWYASTYSEGELNFAIHMAR